MFSKSLIAISLIATLTACSWVKGTSSNSTPTASAHVDCVALKRQLLYNNSNPNTEANTASLYQRQQLKQLYQQNCH